MMENLLFRNCPVCDSTQTELFLSCKDNTVTQETFNIVRCIHCKMVYTDPIPDQESIGKYYKSEKYISHTNTASGLINKIYHLVRLLTVRQKVNLIKKVNGNVTGKILDVGCGTGTFLKECQDNGWDVTGMEPDNSANKTAEVLLKKKISLSLNDIGKSHLYDIITLWHVLEHVHDLNSTIDQLKNLLTTSGHLIIAVPNHESYDAKYYKHYWAAYDVPRHLYHFSKSSLSMLMENHNLSVSSIIPMKFDSFYVSMMSEKYISEGSLFKKMANPLLRGFLSNLNANNHSSLIYVIRNKK